MTNGKSSLDDLLQARHTGALNDLMPVVYEELKRIARAHRRDEASFSTTELVHETFLKLANGKNDWEGRAHFFGAASHAMRQVLVDFARHRGAVKRGGDVQMVSLGQSDAAVEIELDEILALDTALERLDTVDNRLRQIVELRFFAGLSHTAIAEILGVSARTVERDWMKARLVLLEAIGRS
jgi:RNA polymerase sigma factor (TIGR02999 family)